MKKTILRIAAATLVMVMLCMTLSACGKLSGTYENNTMGFVITYTFTGDTYERTMIGLTDYDTGLTTRGTYRISSGKIVLTPEAGLVEELTYSRSGKTIYIADMEFVKK